MKDRNTIETAFTWDFTHIYGDAAGLDEDLAACAGLTETMAGFRGKLAESSDTLEKAS